MTKIFPIIATVAAATIAATSLAGVTSYSTISVGPETTGWYNEAGLTSTVTGGFDGQIGPITATFTNGTGTIINFEASTPVVPGPAGLAGLLGLAVVGRRRRR